MPLDTPLRNPDFPDSIVSERGGAIPDTRNVIDHYKYWSRLDIQLDLQRKSVPIEVVAENFAHDFNLATVVRNANAFGARGVHTVGRKHWDRRGAVGTYHYTPVKHHPDARLFYQQLRRANFFILAVDNVPGAGRIEDIDLPQGPTAVIFGQESIGISNIALENADAVVQIEQFGSVRSLNVGVCSGIVLHMLSGLYRR